MDEFVPIIEIGPDGQYKPDDQLLKSIIFKATNCNRIAIISTIGSKRLDLRWLLSNLSSDRKLLENTSGTLGYKRLSNETDQFNTPSIRMWSNPFVFGNKDNKTETAVFLMDTNNIFTEVADNPIENYLDNLLDTFCSMSSTVIYTYTRDLNVSQYKEITFTINI